VLREFGTFDLRFPLEYFVPEVPDQAPRVHLKSMTLVHFGTSAFGSLNFPRPLPPGTLSPGVHDLLMCVSCRSRATINFKLFGLWEFQTPTLASSQSTSTRSTRSVDACPSGSDGPLSTLALWASGVSNSYALVPPRVVSPEDDGFHHVSFWMMDGPWPLRDFGESSLLCACRDLKLVRFAQIQRSGTIPLPPGWILADDL
jgi:hypothetical protein